ncbi:MAG TPA: hypothetical protein VMV72_09495 [Verrucomicrobiae bacterium]|nr:hypothetical protein [Verrucomicrobiae bacterium]
MNTETEPKLAPPGAGLPALELLIARALFRVRRWTGDRESFTTKFQEERGRIRQLIDDKTAARRVLIRRLPGLEDGSRYWSVWMTLDHLRIVHNSMRDVIRALTSGVMPTGTASTAAVTPSLNVTGAVVAEYEKSCDELLVTVAAAHNLQTPLRYAHPWFGPLDAAVWHALAATHIRIHRKQIERIVAGCQPKVAESAR